MKIVIPKSELQKNINLAAGWYPAEFIKMETRPASDKISVNYYGTFKLECDAREMDTLVCNSKALRMMQTLIESLKNSKLKVVDKVVQEDAEFTPEEYYGTKVQVKLEDEPYQGRMISKIKDYLPIGAETAMPFAV